MQAGLRIADRFVMERRLRKGGMGEVWIAHDEAMGQRVAIKVLREYMLEQRDAVTRFLREARIVAKIDSPYAVRIIQAGELPDARGPYIAMDLLDGQDLAEVLRAGGPVSFDRAVTFVLQVCHAVARAHAAGIVHRDLKPSNLFLVQGGTPEERVIVLDFGISKLAEDDGSLTGTGDALGTPRYMPPEQIRSSRSADARSDVWALGVILFELVTGALPFVGDSGAAFIVAALGDSPRGARELREDVPLGLEEAIHRCLRKDPAERYQSVTELALALAPLAPRRAKALLVAIDGAVRGPRPLGGTQPLSAHREVLAGILSEAAETLRLSADQQARPAEEVEPGPSPSPASPAGAPSEKGPPEDRRQGGAQEGAFDGAAGRTVRLDLPPRPRSRAWSLAALAVVLVGGGAAFVARRWAPARAPAPSATVAGPPGSAEASPSPLPPIVVAPSPVLLEPPASTASAGLPSEPSASSPAIGASSPPAPSTPRPGVGVTPSGAPPRGAPPSPTRPPTPATTPRDPSIDMPLQ